jgi:hypothetical protein
MKYHTLSAAFAITFSILLASPAFIGAAEVGAGSPSSDTQRDEVDLSITGTVQSLDSASDSLTIEDQDGNVKSVTVDGETKFIRNGKPIDWNVIKRGDVVTVQNPKMII